MYHINNIDQISNLCQNDTTKTCATLNIWWQFSNIKLNNNYTCKKQYNNYWTDYGKPMYLNVSHLKIVVPTRWPTDIAFLEPRRYSFIKEQPSNRRFFEKGKKLNESTISVMFLKALQVVPNTWASSIEKRT